jgi:hypothetical protein
MCVAAGEAEAWAHRLGKFERNLATWRQPGWGGGRSKPPKRPRPDPLGAAILKDQQGIKLTLLPLMPRTQQQQMRVLNKAEKAAGPAGGSRREAMIRVTYIKSHLNRHRTKESRLHDLILATLACDPTDDTRRPVSGEAHST